MPVPTRVGDQPAHRKSSRRSRVAIAVLVMLTAVVGTSIRVLDAGATTSPNGFIWTVDSNVSTYRNFVDNLRNHFTLIYDQTRQTSTDRNDNELITLVNPDAPNSNNMIRIQIEMDSLYLVGWDTGPNTLFRYGTNPVPTDFPAGNNREQLQMDLNYGNTRQGLSVGFGATQAAINTLANFRNGDRNSDPARRALVVLAQVLAEAVRFRAVENDIAAGWTTGHTLTDPEMSIENDWDKLSGAMKYVLNNPTAAFSYTNPFDGSQVRTLAGLGALLGLLYTNATPRLP